VSGENHDGDGYFKFALSASPGTTVNEGDATRISADLTLEMGRSYYYQIFDSQNNDITPGRMNVTASAIRLGFSQPQVNPGGVFLHQIQAKSRGSRARQNVNLITRSVSDARAIDIGRAKLKAVVKKER